MRPVSPLPPHTRRLSNGAELCVVQQPWAERAGLCLRVAAGSHDEPAAYPGLAHFLEHLLFLGSRGYAAEQGLMAFAQGCGGQVNASTQARHTDFVCELPAERLQPALLRLFDMLRWPLLERAAQLREREVLHAEYQARSADADSRINHALAQALAAGHRCADFLAGDRASLAVEQSAFAQALTDYHQRHYQAAGMRLVLVGPQPPAELLEIGRELLGELPAGAVPARASAPPMLPLRAPRLGLQHDAAGLYLAYAVQVDDPALAAALDLLLDVLQEPAPGGLLDGLRAARLCQRLQAQLLYRHAGQCLLRLDCVGSAVEQGAALIAELQGWLRRVRDDAAWPARLADWRRARGLRQRGMGPLALACSLQQDPTEPDDASLLRALAAVLEQLASGAGLIELVADCQPRPLWPATGLTLPLGRLALLQWPVARLDCRLAPLAALLDVPARVEPIASLARIRHYSGSADGGPAALYWRGDCPAPLALSGLQARCADLQGDCERLGITLQLGVHADGWTLTVQGAAELLPACSARVLPLLLAPAAEAPPASESGLLLRQLLQRLPQLCGAAGSGLQGLSVGLEAAQQAQLAALFARVESLPTAPMPAAAQPALRWHQVAQPGSDVALLLLCPLTTRAAHSEAAWRVLGQLLQGAFYRRLRGELQLGYALFAGYRQVQGSRALLFALQSPVCDAAGIFGHIRAFLGEQCQRLAELPPEELQRYRDEWLQSVRPPSSNLARAEQLWQLHLAGLDEAHPQRLRQALAELTPEHLQAACAQLLHTDNWCVLASGPRGNA